MAADRAQHVAEVIGPALDAGRHVVTDRFAGSSLAYQGYGRGLAARRGRASCRAWATDGLWPDLVVLLEVAAGRSRRRASAGDLDRLEAAGDDFHRAGARRASGPQADGRPATGGSSSTATGAVDDVAADDRRPTVRDRGSPERLRRRGWHDGSACRRPRPTSIDAWADGRRAAARRSPRCGRAVAHPVHAYLLVGPSGSGQAGGGRGRSRPSCSRPAATARTRDRHRRLALAEQHPDLARRRADRRRASPIDAGPGDRRGGPASARPRATARCWCSSTSTSSARRPRPSCSRPSRSRRPAPSS